MFVQFSSVQFSSVQSVSYEKTHGQILAFAFYVFPFYLPDLAYTGCLDKRYSSQEVLQES